MLYGELVGIGERPPWTTDAGRIYLRFGEPDERLINHFPSGSDSRTVGGVSGLQGEPPYEIWSYHSTGFLYLFTEENQFGVWRMISEFNLDSKGRGELPALGCGTASLRERGYHESWLGT